MRDKCPKCTLGWCSLLWTTFVVLSEIGCLFAAYSLLKRTDNRVVNARFSAQAKRITNSMRIQLDTVEYSLRRTAAIFNVNRSFLSADDYAKILQDAVDPIKTLVEVHSFIARVTDKERPAFEAFCSASIQTGCEISELTKNGTALQRSPPRSIYYPVMLMSPKPYTAPSGQALFGLDLNTNFAGAQILDFYKRAESDNVVVSSRVSIRTPDVNPNTHAVSMAAFSSVVTGYHTTVIRVERLVDTACARISLKRSLVSARVTDVTEGKGVLLFAEIGQQNKTLYQTSNFIFAGDRKWSVLIDFDLDFVNSARSSLPQYITLALAGFLLLADCILVLGLLSYRRTQSMRVAVAEQERASSMLSFINHEVRNPLNIILGLVNYTLDILKDLDSSVHGRVSPRETVVVNKTMLSTAISDLAAVVGACDMLEHVVTDIMVIQKLEANILPLCPRSCLVEDIVTEIKVMLQQKMEEHKAVVFTTECSSNFVVILDPFRLKQILTNLLLNSVKYTRSGSINLQVSEIYDQQQKHSIRFSVHDTGCGVPLTQQHKLFQAHSSVNKNDVTLHKSQGLGLYLCKLLATRMQGTVGFSSRPTGGSTFWVQLPFECSNDLDESVCSSVRSSLQ